MRTALRSLGLAVATLILAGALGYLGAPTIFLLLPGFWVAWFGTETLVGGYIAFFGVNLLCWWALWAFALVAYRRMFSEVGKNSNASTN